MLATRVDQREQLRIDAVQKRNFSQLRLGADIDTIPLVEEDLFVVAQRQPRSKLGPIELRELARLPLIIPCRPHSIRMLVESELASIGLHPQIGLEVDGITGILDLVADGAGCAVLSMNAVTTSGKADLFAVRPIVEPQLRSRLALAVSARRPITRTQQAMLELMGGLCKRLLGANTRHQTLVDLERH